MDEKARGIGGRKEMPIFYVDVTYNDKSYTVGIITTYEDKKYLFVIDTEDKERVAARNWHMAVRNKYVASSFVATDGSKKNLYLHNFVMNVPFSGKGSELSIDHINGIETDNRKENLRLVSQSFQNFNTSNRVRKTTKLPSGFDLSRIPRNIYYIPASGSHGERFGLEIKGIPDVGIVEWKSTSSKEVSLDEKLSAAIAKKNEIFEKYPILKAYLRNSEESLLLSESLNKIIELALI
jgi:hypothetical protein